MSLGAWWWTSLPADGGAEVVVPAASPGEAPSAEGPPVVVHVAGQVRRPGVVRLPAGSRVVDAIEAAGGATPSAVLAGVNLAATLVDGSQIVVPAVDDGREPIDDGIVAINTASAAELESLPGVGPVLAGRIVAHRDANGSFGTVEDLLDVSGIGEAILAQLRPFIRVP